MICGLLIIGVVVSFLAGFLLMCEHVNLQIIVPPRADIRCDYMSASLMLNKILACISPVQTLLHESSNTVTVHLQQA